MTTIELRVPDIGDFKDVAIIEILVKPGDTVAADQSLITVESDKASMEIPATSAGVIQALKVKLGDKINQGDLIALVEGSAAASAAVAAPAPIAPAPATPAAPPAAAVPVAAPIATAIHTGGADLDCEVLVLGGGPGGYSAAFRAADLG
ncbi:biotin/lipoyl-containing protein, partial [Inhella gelatinilytica]